MKSTLKLLASILLSFLVTGGFYFFFKATAPQKRRFNPPASCDLHQSECSVDLSDQGTLTFGLSPRPVPFTDPFEMTVRLAGVAPEQVLVDFAGLTKDTGYKRIALIKEASREGAGESSGVFRAKTDLTHCNDPVMEWQVTVMLEVGKDTWLVPFTITTKRETAAAASSSDNLQLAQKPQGSDFVLNSVSGPLDTKTLRGRYLFVYFGYTFCPDICPTALLSLGGMLKQLTPGELEKTEAIFISVDPERDKLEQLEKYVKHFHKKMYGVTGETNELEKIARSFGAKFKTENVESGSAANNKNYTVSHTGDTYLLSPEGRLLHAFAHGTSAQDLLKEYREILQKKE